jgi:hypothetical protein
MPQRRYVAPVQSKVEKAKPSGYASLDTTGHVPASQISGGGGGGSPIASATVTGTVKTNTTVADPIVYRKSEVDTLLAAKLNTSDPSVTNARTPTAHAASHASGGTDPVSPASIGAAAVSHVHSGGDITTGTVAVSRGGTGTDGSSVAQNRVLASPDGSAGAIGFRPLVAADIPALAESKVTNLVADLAAKEATANKGAASGYASLDGTTKVPIAQIPTGTTGTTVPFGNDARFSDARTPTAHAASHAAAGSDPLTLSESQVTNLTTDLAARVQVGGQLGGTATSPTVLGLRETSGPTLLTAGAVADGQFLKRVGTTVVGASPTATVAGGTATLAFGTTGSDTASVAVADATVTGTSKVLAYLQVPASDSPRQRDEYWVEDITVLAGNVSAGVGFTIYGRCGFGRAVGDFTVNYAVL